MEISDALEHVRSNSHAVLTTVRADGTPQMSPVLVAVLGPDVVVSTRASSAKAVNLRRDPRAWLCVLPDAFFGEWAQLSCWAQVVEQPEALDALERYYRALSGEHPDWPSYREAMVAEDRVLLRLEVDAAGPG